MRKDLKLRGWLPTDDQVADARTGMTGFLEDNTPKVFGIEFATIDMADVVPQEAARAQLKAATAAEANGERTEAIAQIAEAFRDLFHPYASARQGAAHGFGVPLDNPVGFPIGVESGFGELAGSAVRNRRGVMAIGGKVDDRIAHLTKVASAMQRGMRVLALGIDYARYDRFERLTPQVWFTGEHRQVHVDGGYAPTREVYDYCAQFLITAALRIAEVEAAAADPSWHPRWPQ